MSGRRFRYMEYDGTGPIYVEISEEQILREYFKWWSEQMRRADKSEYISAENCLNDFCVVYWAGEVKPTAQF